MPNHLLVYISTLNCQIVTRASLPYSSKDVLSLWSDLTSSAGTAGCQDALCAPGIISWRKQTKPMWWTTNSYILLQHPSWCLQKQTIQWGVLKIFHTSCHNFCCWHCSQAITQSSYVVPQTGWVEPGNKVQGGNNWNIPLSAKSNQQTT